MYIKEIQIIFNKPNQDMNVEKAINIKPLKRNKIMI